MVTMLDSFIHRGAVAPPGGDSGRAGGNGGGSVTAERRTDVSADENETWNGNGNDTYVASTSDSGSLFPGYRCLVTLNPKPETLNPPP